jgi:hypothetical protein
LRSRNLDRKIVVHLLNDGRFVEDWIGNLHEPNRMSLLVCGFLRNWNLFEERNEKKKRPKQNEAKSKKKKA